MGILNVILQVVLIFVSILLVAVILIQRNKGAGAGVSFGMGEAVFGSDMGNVLTRTTIVLGIIFLAIVLGLSLLPGNNSAAGSIMKNRGAAVPVQSAAVDESVPAGDVALPVDAEAAAAEAAAPAAATEAAAPAAAEAAAPAAAEAAAPAAAEAAAPAAAQE